LRLRLAARAALCAALALAPQVRAAVDPVEVEVEGIAAVDPAKPGGARDAAFSAALVAAVVEVAEQTLSPEQLQGNEDRVREAMAADAPKLILGYKVQPGGGARASSLDPTQREYALRLRASVDRAQVRKRLAEAGLTRASGERPSLVVVARAAEPGAVRAPALISLEDRVKQALAGARFIVIEPALRRSDAPELPAAVDLARTLGADVAVDLEARWTPRATGERASGGVLEVAVSALRTRDAVPVGLARFESAAYHTDPGEAQSRAADALAPQVAENLLLQLQRNWEALSAEAPPTALVLGGVGSLAQVEAVAAALRGRLGAERVELRALRPRTAELEVRGPLSPGALQDRLAALAFDGFRLEPVAVTRERVELRVSPPLPEVPAGPP
jgi:hypothetical protein